MAGKTTTTALDFAFKKLLGKANTSNLKSDSQETIGSNIQVGATTVFGLPLPSSPTQTLFTVQNSAVEYVVFDISAIPGTSYDANDPGGGGDEGSDPGAHGYALALTGSYQSLTNNSKAGTFPFTNSQVLSGSAGALQIIPELFSSDSPNPYSLTLYESNGSGGIGDQIPLLDEVDWLIDTFSGVLFLQEFDSNKIPAYAKAFIYAGDMMSSLTGSGGGSGPGDADAEYLVLSATGSLNAERVFTAGAGIKTVDAGAGGAFTLSIKDSIVATLTGSQFSGNVGVTGSIGSTTTITSPAFSGSLTHLLDGTSYLVAGSNVTITSASNGSITIASTGGGGGSGDGDSKAEYLVSSLTGSLSNAKLIEAGSGISITTGSNSLTISSNSSNINGRNKQSYFISSSIPANSQIETQLSNFSEVLFDKNLIDVYLNGQLLHSGSSVEVSASDKDYTVFTSGSVKLAFGLEKDDQLDVILSKLSGNTGNTSDPAAQYLVLQATSSLSAERVLTVGAGLLGIDSGAGSPFTLNINDSIIATLTGSQFSGNVGATGSIGSTTLITSPAFSGSLTHLLDGTSYISAGSGITITSASNGSITIANSTGGTITGVTAGNGLSGGGFNGNITLATAPSSSIYFVTSSHSTGEELVISSANFGRNSYNFEKTQIFVNGSLMLSGSSFDYSLSGTNTGINFNFALRNDDIVIVKYL